MIRQSSILTDSKFPAFVQDNQDFEAIREFVRSYFKSNEVHGKATYELDQAIPNLDIDTCSDDNLIRYFQILCPGIPMTAVTDKRWIIKHARELYEKKGTVDGFKMLFNLLYGEKISVRFPGENILKASDGIWRQPVVIHVNFGSATESQINGLVNYPIQTLNANGIVRNELLTVKRIHGTVYECGINKQKNVLFSIGDVIQFHGGITGVVMPIPNAIKVIKAGKGFRLGQLIRVEAGNAHDTIAKITKIDNRGGVVAVKIIRIGYGYDTHFTMNINPTNYGSISPMTFNPAGIDHVTVDSNKGEQEFGTIMKASGGPSPSSYFLEDYMVPTSYFSGNIVSQFSHEPPAMVYDDLHDYAIISVEIGSVLRFSGYWVGSRGKLSDQTMCLSDNDFYQNFSYVIQSAMPRAKYVDDVRRLMHPAGMKMFGEMMLENQIDISATISNGEVNQYQMYLNDLVDAPDDLRWHLESKKYDNQLMADTAIKIFDTIKDDSAIPTEHSGYAESDYSTSYTEILDGPVKRITSIKSESPVILDGIYRDNEINVTDTVSAIQGAHTYEYGYAVDDGYDAIVTDPTVTVTKSVSDSVSIVEISPWAPGYAVDYAVTPTGINIK